MYAIVEISGQQFRVQKDQEIFVHRQKGDPGSNVEFNSVMVLEKDGKVTVGTPVVNNAVVQAKIVEHLRGDKVIVFKKKRRKGYQVQNGHRQDLSKLVIEDILTNAPAKAVKEEPKDKKETKPEVVAKPKQAKEKELKETPEKPEAPEVEKKSKKEEKTEVKAEVRGDDKSKVPAENNKADKPDEDAPAEEK